MSDEKMTLERLEQCLRAWHEADGIEVYLRGAETCRSAIADLQAKDATISALRGEVENMRNLKPKTIPGSKNALYAENCALRAEVERLKEQLKFRDDFKLKANE